MANEIKFTEEEVSQINQLRQDVAGVFTQLGQLQIEKKRRLDEITNVENDLLQKHSNLVQLEQDIFKGLNVNNIPYIVQEILILCKCYL